MNIGVVFGGFCPLHKGHMDVIMRAKKENDFCFVFVCGYDGEERAAALPLVKRFRIIKNFLADDTMAIEYISDTELGLDESMSDDNWRIWLNALYKKMFAYKNVIATDTFHWYVGEEDYRNQIFKNASQFNFNLRVGCTLFDRTENPISGTMCRENPLRYWNHIMAPFRAYFSHNILIAGTASEGKTTLTHDIGKYFGLPYSYEKGRDICKIKTDPEFTVKDFIYNIYEQHKYNEELICSPQNPGVFISDTDNFVTLMYAKEYARRPEFALTEDDYKLLVDLANTYMKTTKWDKIFLIKPKEKPIVDDGERYMGDSDYEIRLNYYKDLKKLYDDAGLEYEELDGGYYNNFLRVKEYVNGLFENNGRN